MRLLLQLSKHLLQVVREFYLLSLIYYFTLMRFYLFFGSLVPIYQCMTQNTNTPKNPSLAALDSVETAQPMSATTMRFDLVPWIVPPIVIPLALAVAIAVQTLGNLGVWQ